MELIEQLTNYGKAWLRLTKGHVRLFVLEFKLAKSSIIPFIVSLFLLSILILSTWLSFLTFIGYEIYSYSHSILWSLISVLLINILCLMMIGTFVLIYLKQISFTRTRSNLQAYKKLELHNENKTS